MLGTSGASCIGSMPSPFWEGPREALGWGSALAMMPRPQPTSLGYRLRLATLPENRRDGVARACAVSRFSCQIAGRAISQRSAAPVLCDAGASFPVSFSPQRGDGAPGGARELARLPYGPDEGPFAPTAISPLPGIRRLRGAVT